MPFELLYFRMTGLPCLAWESWEKKGTFYWVLFYLKRNTYSFISTSHFHHIINLWINKYFLVPSSSYITQKTHFIQEIQTRIFQIVYKKDHMNWDLWVLEALQANAPASKLKNSSIELLLEGAKLSPQWGGENFISLWNKKEHWVLSKPNYP